MQTYRAELVDLNFCYKLNSGYTTEYVWQMQSWENERTVDIRFDTVRLPRPMRVAYPRSSDELMDHWRREGCFLVVRNLQGEIVGFLDALPQSWQNILWIANLVIDPDFRRQGFGTALLEAAGTWAAERRLRQLTLEIQTKNYPAISFAEKHGFQFCGYNENYYPNGDIALFFSLSI